ncbi:hypothetical protein [Algisphaera agarilytica]|uniref:Pantothenate kinase n=1 Tax=Algisphaera agarilytica TaxID=1385975 RepID=A0A7X0LLS4_9BACT|nr:hypothetical protein [Algisphaera agarilytica]MBB6431219.1 pantothenate kinase [Algisphaera agarilytica]
MDADEPFLLTDEAITQTAQAWRNDHAGNPHRFLIGIAGIAGSGKSTLAERLVDEVNRLQPGAAAFIPMDGFHLRNAELIAQGWKPRKGAAFTYDSEAYVELLQRYRTRDSVGGYPVYCRIAHEPIPAEDEVTAQTQIIVTEGQYLLCPDLPWARLNDVLDECWWLDLAPETARGWLMKRDLAVGRSPEEAEAKYQRNDRLNTEMVLSARRTPDRVVRWPSVDEGD